MGSRSSQVVGIALVVAACAAVVRAHLFAFEPLMWLNADEGYAAALATRLLERGGLPYVDAISLRGPLMYWIYEAALAMGGSASLEAIRYAGIVSSLAVVLGAAAIPATVGSPLAAGAASLLCAAALSLFWSPPDGLAWNGEIIGLPFVLVSTALAIAASRTGCRNSSGWIVASGALAACAFFVKQSLGPHALWTVVWLAAVAPRAARLRVVAAFGVGGAGVAILVLAPYVATGSLAEFWYYFVRYGREIYMAPVTGADVARVVRTGILERAPSNLLLAVGLLGCFGIGLASVRNQRLRNSLEWWILIAGHTLVAIPCATFTGRYFGHYFLQVDVFAAILFALAVFGVSIRDVRDADSQARAGERVTRRDRRPVLAAIAGAGMLIFLYAGQNQIWERFAAANILPTRVPAEDSVANWIRANSDADDALFVWGVRGEIYINAGRSPASRFVYCLFPSGVVPWFLEPIEVQSRRIVPGSQSALLKDLEESQPPLIVDEGNSLMGRFMTDYPVFRVYLQRNYCMEETIEISGEDGAQQFVPVYRRRQPDRPCRPIPDP